MRHELDVQPPGPLIVFAPGSLNGVRDHLVAEFARIKPGVVVQLYPPAYSGVLARQILDGAPADLFISASWSYLDVLVDAGLLSFPVTIAGNALAIVVRPELAPTIRDVADLARPGLRLLAPPADTDPLGRYTAELFGRAGLTGVIAEKRARGEISEHLATLQDGLRDDRVDAAVVYASGLNGLRDVSVAVTLPPPFDLSDQIVFGAGAVRRANREHPAARPFLDFLTGPDGQHVLESAGFAPRSKIATPPLE